MRTVHIGSAASALLARLLVHAYSYTPTLTRLLLHAYSNTSTLTLTFLLLYKDLLEARSSEAIARARDKFIEVYFFFC